jgi:hypothetical protein
MKKSVKKRKKWHDKRCQKIGSKPKRNKKYDPNKLVIYKNNKNEFKQAEAVIAPANICLLSATDLCLKFFSDLRKIKNISKQGRTCFVQMDISEVTEFDYSSICVLIAIIGDLKSKGIYFRGNYPLDNTCKNNIIESGLLTFMYDNEGKPFNKSEKSDLLFIEKGSKKLTKEDNIRISNTVKNVSLHLTGVSNHIPKLRTILLEICGNSIEWGGTTNRQWLFGVRYDDDKAIFTITDVGRGILKTLNIKFKRRLKDVFTFKSDDEILKGAFIKKYGSSSKKINRNKGLPSIKNGYEIGIIQNLKVLTNNVLIHYDKKVSSEILVNNQFKGTFYRWEVTKDTILKTTK